MAVGRQVPGVQTAVDWKLTVTPTGTTVLGGVTETEVRTEGAREITTEEGDELFVVPFRLAFAVTEAVVAVCKEVFRSLPIRRIEATVLAENIPSGRVLAHAGFVKEGTRRQATLRGSSWRDVDIYGLLKDD